MSDDAKKDAKPAFTVSDRRKRFDGGDGEAKPEAAAAKPEPEAVKEPAPTAPAGQGGEGVPFEPAPAGEPGPGGDAGPIGPAEFVQLVGKLYEEALVFMGYHDDPQAAQSMRNLPIASWHIDILEVLREKTKGNLSQEETKLIEDAVANLKLLFVRASGYIKH